MALLCADGLGHSASSKEADHEVCGDGRKAWFAETSDGSVWLHCWILFDMLIVMPVV
jgi:hypothetical protein